MKKLIVTMLVLVELMSGCNSNPSICQMRYDPNRITVLNIPFGTNKTYASKEMSKQGYYPNPVFNDLDSYGEWKDVTIFGEKAEAVRFSFGLTSSSNPFGRLTGSLNKVDFRMKENTNYELIEKNLRNLYGEPTKSKTARNSGTRVFVHTHIPGSYDVGSRIVSRKITYSTWKIGDVIINHINYTSEYGDTFHSLGYYYLKDGSAYQLYNIFDDPDREIEF